MEIWPARCYSPVHTHGNTNSIIKALHGPLTMYCYKSSDPQDADEPYASDIVAASDVTWLDDRQFQVHRLFNHNTNETACVTICVICTMMMTIPKTNTLTG